MTNLSVLCTWVRNEVHKIDKFGEKIADLDSPGYYLSDDTKTKNGPLHHHINVFSDNSVHWWQLCSCYGATETTAPVTNNLPGEGWHREGSVGRSGNGALNELLLGPDPDSSGVGEIVCGSRNVFMGYHRDGRKTAEAFTEDAWYRTGDQVRGHLGKGGGGCS